MKKLATSLLLGTAALAATIATAEVTRHPLPGSDFPIAQAVEVTAGSTIVYHSGMTPRPANQQAERYSEAFWGDTEAQTLSVFGRLEESLKAKGLGRVGGEGWSSSTVNAQPSERIDPQGQVREVRGKRRLRFS